MYKVWAFGDSDTAGHELGSKKINFRNFLKARNFNTAYEAQKSLSDKQYEDFVSQWLKQIDNIQTPELSYAGQVASLLGRNLISNAVTGASVDEQILRLSQTEDKIDWKNDLVIFGVPRPYRWMTHTGECVQASRVLRKSKTQKLWMEVGMSNIALNIYYASAHTYIKQRWPQVLLIRMHSVLIDPAINLKKMQDCFFSKVSLAEFANDNYGQDCTYPGGHFREFVHESYASLLLDMLTKDKKYSKIIK